MSKTLLIGILSLCFGAFLLGGCSGESSEGPAEIQKVLTDEEFEKSIENAPEAAKASARAARANAQNQMAQTPPPKK